MSKIEVLSKEYNELKDKYLKNGSLNLKEDLKNKLIELDYEINREYEENLKNNFPMTTTIDKEEVRLVKLIDYINSKIEEQKKLVEDYKKLTGLNIELSYLKYSDKLTEYKQRLDLVRKFLSIKKDLVRFVDSSKDVNGVKAKVLKNRLMKKEMLNLLYEFCLIDDLEVKEIDLEKILKEEKSLEKEDEKVEVKDLKENLSKLIKKEEAKEEKREELPKEKIEVKEVLEPVISLEKEEENKILTTMPKIDKLGTVTPVNVFESLKKTQEKLPDVVIPSNGLAEESSEIFVDTKQYFN